MANLLFDFDGTLADSRMRLYWLFRELCPEAEFTFGEYWRLKRSRITQREMLAKFFGYGEESCREFHRIWLERVEEPKRMALDEPVEGAERLLRELAEGNRLYLLTARQNPQLAEAQLAGFGWSGLFAKVFATGGVLTKAECVRELELSTADAMIGDTGEDVQTARELGVKAVAVEWGTLSREVLATYLPDVIVGSVEELAEILKGK